MAIDWMNPSAVAELEALTRRVVEQQAEVEKANTSAIFSYNRWGDALREIDVLRAKLAVVMSILRRLADAADELLTRHSYDGHGHEEVSHCRDKARDQADAIDAALRATLASTAPEDKDDAEDWQMQTNPIRETLASQGASVLPDEEPAH